MQGSNASAEIMIGWLQDPCIRNRFCANHFGGTDDYDIGTSWEDVLWESAYTSIYGVNGSQSIDRTQSPCYGDRNLTPQPSRLPEEVNHFALGAAHLQSKLHILRSCIFCVGDIDITVQGKLHDSFSTANTFTVLLQELGNQEP